MKQGGMKSRLRLHQASFDRLVRFDSRYVKIDQSVAPEDRGKIIDSFNNDPAVKVMLLGMKCGGSGRIGQFPAT